MKKKIIVVLIIASALIGTIILKNTLSAEKITSKNPNYEAVATVKEIIDGDTLKVKVTKIFDPHKGVNLGDDKIRLAGIDTEETLQDKAVKKHEDVKNLNQEQYEKTIYYQQAITAKKFLKNKLPEGKKIYLDIDDLADGKYPYRGYYGRLIALVYVKDSEKWININAQLLKHTDSFDNSGLNNQILTKFHSEFDPYNWLSEDYPYT